MGVGSLLLEGWGAVGNWEQMGELKTAGGGVVVFRAVTQGRRGKDCIHHPLERSGNPVFSGASLEPPEHGGGGLSRRGMYFLN